VNLRTLEKLAMDVLKTGFKEYTKAEHLEAELLI